MSVEYDFEGWKQRAACRGPQNQLFFPPPTFERKKDKLEREAQAKQICGTCAVRRDCLDFALDVRESHGIWGGLNEAERNALLVR